MKNFCIFCGQRLVDGACACSDYRAYYGVAEAPQNAVFENDPARSVVETTAYEAPAPAPEVNIPDAGPTIYSGAAAPVAPAPAPEAPAAPAGFGFTPAPEKKVSSDSHFRSAGDL